MEKSIRDDSFSIHTNISFPINDFKGKFVKHVSVSEMIRTWLFRSFSLQIESVTSMKFDQIFPKICLDEENFGRMKYRKKNAFFSRYLDIHSLVLFHFVSKITRSFTIIYNDHREQLHLIASADQIKELWLEALAHLIDRHSETRQGHVILEEKYDEEWVSVEFLSRKLLFFLSNSVGFFIIFNWQTRIVQIRWTNKNVEIF